VICVIAVMFGLFRIVGKVHDLAQTKSEYEELKGAVTVTVPSSDTGEEQTQQPDDGYLQLDYGKLIEINPDFKGWIEIPDTEISYPIVQSGDNDYYLRRTFEGNESFGGVIFIDYRTPGDFSGRNTVIYGHRMNDGSMFGSLKEYLDAKYFESHDTVRIYTEDCVLEYKVFSVSETTTGSDCFTFGFESDQVYHEWMQRQIERSVYDTGVYPDATDKVITLVTCTGDEEWRYVIQAVLSDFTVLDMGE